MSTSALASSRPAGGRFGLRRAAAATGLLYVQVKSPTAIVHLRAEPKRHQSNAPAPRDNGSAPGKPQITFRQFAGRALGVSLRNLALALSPRGIRQSYRENPAVTSLNVLLLLFTFVFSAVAIRAYINTFYNSQFSRYPEPVANTLRRAVYYTNVKPDPELALRYYKKAMEQCGEVGLDPFSDEVLGVRIQVSFWLEKINSHKAAIDVLESVLGDCRRWIDVMEKSVKDGKVDGRGRYVGDARQTAAVNAASGGKTDGEAAGPAAPAAPAEPSETLWHKRQRLLAKAISTSVKLGELYADEHVLDPDKSHAHLVWAVEASLKEFRRRKTEGPKPGEDKWLSPQELGGSMESLGRDYERRSQFQLAIPLFFQALRLCESPCHRAVVMNNLAAAFAQQPIYAAGSTTEPSEGLKELFDASMPSTRKECLEAGLNWAQNAYVHARDVQGDDRTPECDEACAVALCNWGDVAAMLGKTELAKKKYEECIEMSSKMEFPEGVKQAQQGLARLTATS
ncbi:tpr domain-containing [Trichoderma cornu-damae]|uniref:Tpr domain-containing n=1 Tax=Trichoderma cornu-damae TaxID=654480 RepID=A0A9P8QQW4_9HYPO|nr:tpr domain-containing [Trichoderma cornu-damae]